MGKAFAMLHWGAGIDGGGVEFVLGTSVSHADDQGLQHRVVGFWLLNSGDCHILNLEHESVDTIFQVFRDAMPHAQTGTRLFPVQAAYIEASRAIPKEKGL